MDPRDLRHALARWLLLLPVAAIDAGCGPVEQRVVVTLEQARAKARGDGGPDLSALTTINAENCEAICEYVLDLGEWDRLLDCTPTESPSGGPATICHYDTPALGRAPAGLERPGAVTARDALGEYLARAAHLEAASVYAFARLHDELAAHGAPAALRRAAQRSAADELRHARAMARLARAHGATPRRPRVATEPLRSLEATLTENAVEGCVGETYGAVIALHQARAAQRPELRRVYATIARDERAHAALSWAVARWGEARLDRAAGARVATARAEAAEALRARAESVAPQAYRELLGLPDATAARALLRAMQAEIWS